MRIAAVVCHPIGIRWEAWRGIRTIPDPVIGGISIVLFGMIAAIGVRTMVENNVDLKDSRNLFIASVILVVGIGGAMITLWGNAQLGGMGLAAILGIILNQILPRAEA
jgi:uracil permease